MPAAAQAKDWYSNGGNPSVTFVQVYEKLRTRYVIFEGKYSIDSDACFQGWLNNDRIAPLGCEDWEEQRPRQFTLYVRHKGRIVYSDEISGSLVNYAKPYYGATFSTRLYTSDLGSRCQPGIYYWQITLADPLERAWWRRECEAFLHADLQPLKLFHPGTKRGGLRPLFVSYLNEQGPSGAPARLRHPCRPRS